MLGNGTSVYPQRKRRARLKPMAKRPRAFWDEVKTLYLVTEDLRTCAEAYNLKLSTLYHRSTTEKWRQALDMKHKMEAQIKPAGEALIETLARGADSHRLKMHKLTSQKMESIEALPEVENMNDIKTLDGVARKNYGLDSDEKQQVNQLINFQFINDVSV